MKKKLILLGAAALLMCGCGKIPKLSNGDEAVVQFKDGHMISANELYEQIKNTYGLNSLVNMVDKYIYETELKSEVNTAKDYAAAVIQQLRDSYDNESDILQLLSYYGFNSIEAYQDAMYLNYLQNKGLEKYVESTITEDELKDYYENDVYPNMTISHIFIKSNATSTSTEEDKEKEETKAKQKLQEVIDKLNQAKKEGKDINKEFSDLAKEYSEDDGTKNNGGNLEEINIGSFDSEYDELVVAAAKLKDGEYSTDIITTEVGYHVILKTKTGDKKTYDEALDEMKEAIVQDKINADDTLTNKAIEYYRDKYKVDVIDDELKSQYGTYMNNLINSSRNSSN